MSKPDFVHLHVHSHYSLLDGLGKVSELVKRTQELGQTALALTDHGVMYGAIDFYLECKKAGIKPIIGQEAYVARRQLTDKNNALDTKPYHLVLLAKNAQGYKNLIKLTTIAHLEGYYYKPRLDRDTLSRYSEGLIASSACLASETSRLILNKDFGQLSQTVNEYREIFGKDHYYLELQHHPSIPEQQVVNEHIKKLARETGLGLIATNDTHYVNADDRVSHDMLVCIQTGKLVSDTNRMLYTGDFSLKDATEMAAAFSDVPEALSNTVKIADMVDIDIQLNQSLLPEFPLPEGETEESLLRKWCEEGLRQRYTEITPEIRDRLDFELSIVIKTGFPGYLLIVADLMRFAKSRGIFVGPGRGSAAGSIIAFVTGITNIDPLKYGLLFERFLDLNRISMPDIDMDFEDVRRKEVIDYVKEKYGEDHVAGIITFGTIMARAAVRDVGRVLGVAYADVDAIAKVIPQPTQGRHVPLERSIKEVPELQAIYRANPQAKQVLDAAVKLEGTIRHASQHACGIVIAKEPLNEYVPVQAAQGGDIHQITQYSLDPIEKIGLLKMDLLGLSNLTIMRQATEIIRAVHGVEINIDTLPLDDKKTYELLARGDSTGVFQLESSGMKRYIRELKPTHFEDIIAMVALYRPGPMQWIQSFINRKNGVEAITYLHPLAETALKETYGVMVYQEQVMKMSKDMCGFTGPEADTLRKAIGKKIPKLMKEMKTKFIEGAVKNGVAKPQAEEIFKQLEDFAAYCFNKSHAACYALIAYQTAYLKAHYPECFMAALMTSDLDDTDRLSIEIAECERLGLRVLPPDINESFANFSVVKDEQQIRFGLAAIKNVGGGVAIQIVEERKKNGPFESLEDFLGRCSAFVNKKVLENMIKSGALDRFNERANLFGGLELIVKYAADASKNGHANQLDMFGDADKKSLRSSLSLPTLAVDKRQYLTWEKELLGLYLSEHPVKEHQELLQSLTTPIGELTLEQANQSVRIGGIVQEAKKIVTKSNQTMAFVTVEDLTGTVEVVVFPSIFAEQQALWAPDQLLVVTGKVSNKDGVVKVLADRVYPLVGLQAQSLPPLGGVGRSRPAPAAAPTVSSSFTIDLTAATKETMESLKTILAGHPGETPVELRIFAGGSTKIVRPKIRVRSSSQLAEAVAELLKQPQP